MQAETQAVENLSSIVNMSAATETVAASLSRIWQDFLVHLPQILAGAIVLAAVGAMSWILRRVLERVLLRTRMRRSLRELAARLFHIGIWAMGLLLAAMIVFPGLTPTKALGGLGIASVAIGFAFKDIFENFFAGVLILWRFPFDNGDYIECGDLVGRIEEITIRNTLIRRSTGELVVVPNSLLFTEPVEVLTTPEKMRRVSITCGIAYKERLKQAIRVIRGAVQRCSTVTDGRPVEVYAKSFAASGVDLEVTWWTQPEPGEIRRSVSEVLTTVKGALEAAGIEIPFPHRVLMLRGEGEEDSHDTSQTESRLAGVLP